MPKNPTMQDNASGKRNLKNKAPNDENAQMKSAFVEDKREIARQEHTNHFTNRSSREN
jgi:hypothetical protein